MNFPKVIFIHFLLSHSKSDDSIFDFQPNGLLGCPLGCATHSWPFGPLFLIPPSHSWTFRPIFWSLLLLWTPLSVPSLPGPLRIFPFLTTGTAGSISRFRAAGDFCRDHNTVVDPLIAPWRRRTTKHSRCFCRSSASSVAPRFASMFVASILSELSSEVITATSIAFRPAF
jgi:hypothetical protein